VAVIFITEVFNTSFSIIKLLSISGTSTPVLKWVIKPLVSIILSTILTRTIFDLGLMTRIFGIVPYGKGFLALELGIAGVIYLVISRVLGAISREDIRWGKRIISRKA
jgi:hypothetical protein